MSFLFIYNNNLSIDLVLGKANKKGANLGQFILAVLCNTDSL